MTQSAWNAIGFFTVRAFHSARLLDGSMQQEVSASPDRLLRPREVARLLGISLSTLWNWSRLGRLPRPIAVGPHATAWRLSEIQQFIDGLPRKGDSASPGKRVRGLP